MSNAASLINVFGDTNPAEPRVHEWQKKPFHTKYLSHFFKPRLAYLSPADYLARRGILTGLLKAVTVAHCLPHPHSPRQDG